MLARPLVVLVALVLACAPAVPSASAAAGRAPISGGRQDIEALPSCPKGPLFSVIPLDPADFIAFRPLGFPQPPQHIFGAKHSSFTINIPGRAVVSGKPVRFPSDAWVTEIVSTESPEGSGFQVTFSPCREFKSYLFHLGTIAPALAAELKGPIAACQDFDFGTGGGKITKCTTRSLLKVSAGDDVGGSDAFAGVDWGGIDYRVDLAFVNKSRYDGDFPHSVSPVEYVTPALRAIFDTKLGSIDGKVRRTAEPRTGTLMQDVPGTAQGNWFTPGTSFTTDQDFSPWLGLLHDYVDPALPIFSMGSSVIGLRMALYAFTPRSSGTVNRDFRDVRPDGNVYCYEGFLRGPTPSALNVSDLAGVILMIMPTATTLRVEAQPVRSCQDVRPMSPLSATFER